MDAIARQALEAIVFVADEPVEASTLSQVLEVGRTEVEAELRALADRLVEEGRGFILRRVGGGWRLYTAPAVAPYVERWVVERRTGRLTQAALETLAVIAYKQPISRQEIGEIRGVNADAAVRTLVARGLVEEMGRDPGPGQAILYGTTRALLEKLGLNDLSELPPLSDFLTDGAAPDEPAPGLGVTARSRVRAGNDLPVTGRSTWRGDDPDPSVGPAVLASPPRGARRSWDRELDELTEDMDLAARKAMAVLEAAMSAGEGESGLPQDGAAGASEPTAPDPSQVWP